MPAFDTNHPLAWHLAQQTIRIDIVFKSAALLQESFIPEETTKNWMYDRVTQLPTDGLILPVPIIDTVSGLFSRMALISGGTPPTSNYWQELCIKFEAD